MLYLGYIYTLYEFAKNVNVVVEQNYNAYHHLSS
jgi:hypothetical protein